MLELPRFFAEEPCLIGKVADDFGALSNMSPHVIFTCEAQSARIDMWPRAEHLFQALRFDVDHDLRRTLQVEKNPMKAKMLVKPRLGEATVVPRSDADLANMRHVIRLKVNQHVTVRRLLLSTRPDRVIVEDCSRRSSESGLFWGAKLVEIPWPLKGSTTPATYWEGHKWLGRLWMELRSELLA